MNNLPKVVMQLCPKYDLNPRPVDRKSNALPVAPPDNEGSGVCCLYQTRKWPFWDYFLPSLEYR